MNRDSFENQLRLVLGNLRSLEQRSEQPEEAKEGLLLESLEELRTTLEELQVADEQLRVGSDELAAAQTQLAAEQLRYRDLFELAPDGELVTDPRGTIRAANVAAGQLLHVAAVFLVGKPLATYIPIGERPAFRAVFRQAVQRGLRLDWEARIQPRQGEPFDAALTVAPIRDARGQLEGFRWILRDITARKRAEEEANALRADLERRVAARTAELEAANRAKDALLFTISHDLKNPLTIIKGYAQLLRRMERSGQPANPTRRDETLAKIDVVVNRMMGQIEEIVDVTRVRLGEPPSLNRRPTDLVALTRQAVAEYQQSSPDHQFHFESVEASLVGPVDPTRLGRALDNLLSNAVKFSPSGSCIVVGLAREKTEGGSWAILSVRDQGIGIPASDLPRIFELFHRADNVGSGVQGSGIGLASVRQIVELHGGTIAAESQEGRGTIFHVRLPLG